MLISLNIQPASDADSGLYLGENWFKYEETWRPLCSDINIFVFMEGNKWRKNVATKHVIKYINDVYILELICALMRGDNLIDIKKCDAEIDNRVCYPENALNAII